MLNMDNENYWARKALGTSASASILIYLLTNTAGFIDRYMNWPSPSVSIRKTFDFSGLICKPLEHFGQRGHQFLSRQGVVVDRLMTLNSDIELRLLYAEWAILGIISLSAAKVTTVTWRDAKVQVSTSRIPREVPDHTALGLLTDIVPPSSNRPSTFSATELDASFINSGPFSLAVTNLLDEHLTFDSTTGHILVFWDHHVLPGGGSLVMKGNRMAK
jgi:hypothetical protein